MMVSKGNYPKEKPDFRLDDPQIPENVSIQNLQAAVPRWNVCWFINSTNQL